MEIINVSPKNQDLYIKGELLGIELNHTSFTIKTQLHIGKNYPDSFMIHKNTFPLEFLSKFFSVNVGYVCTRVQEPEPVSMIRMNEVSH
jgi:hypothetical protein